MSAAGPCAEDSSSTQDCPALRQSSLLCPVQEALANSGQQAAAQLAAAQAEAAHLQAGAEHLRAELTDRQARLDHLEGHAQVGSLPSFASKWQQLENSAPSNVLRLYVQSCLDTLQLCSSCSLQFAACGQQCHLRQLAGSMLRAPFRACKCNGHSCAFAQVSLP